MKESDRGEKRSSATPCPSLSAGSVLALLPRGLKYVQHRSLGGWGAGGHSEQWGQRQVSRCPTRASGPAAAPVVVGRHKQVHEGEPALGAGLDLVQVRPVRLQLHDVAGCSRQGAGRVAAATAGRDVAVSSCDRG